MVGIYFIDTSLKKRSTVIKHPIAKHGHAMTPLYEGLFNKAKLLLVNSPTVLANLTIGPC
jgi:hypothetical protein